MALAQIYSAIAGDIITAARWNNEFGNIYSNGTDVSFPVTKAVSFAGFTLTMDAAGVTTMTSSATQAFQLTPGSKAGTPGTNGSFFNLSAGTFTDTGTSASGTVALWNNATFRIPTLAATNALVTTTDASTVYIEGPPTAGTNETLTNAWALFVDSGNSRFDGNVQVSGTVTALSGIKSATFDPYMLTNLKLTAVASGSALTVALKTDAGTDPTSTDVVSVRFRNGTLATGGTTQVNITSALSLVLSSGSTLGTVSGQASRIYIGLLNNGGTAELFAYNPLSGTNLRKLVESTLITTTAEGGAGAADSAQVPYSTAARATKAFRIIGFVESTQATAGTWATQPSTIQELQPWMPRTGDVVGTAYTSDGVSQNNLAETIPRDDTIPQSGEGKQILTVSYSPVFASGLSVVDISANIAGLGYTGASGITGVVVALFSSVSANALVTSAVHSGTSKLQESIVSSMVQHRSAVLGAMTSVQIRAGSHGATGADSWFFNSESTTLDLGATHNTWLSVTETMV